MMDLDVPGVNSDQMSTKKLKMISPDQTNRTSSRSGPSLLDLPPELLLEISSYITTIADLNRLTQTSKALNHLLLNRLYKSAIDAEGRSGGLQFAAQRNLSGTISHFLAVGANINFELQAAWAHFFLQEPQWVGNRWLKSICYMGNAAVGEPAPYGALHAFTRPGILRGTPLSFAIHAKRPSMVRLLVANGADLNLTHGINDVFSSALRDAVIGKSEAMVKLVLELGSDPNLGAEEGGEDLLFLTTEYRLLRVLLEAGLDPNVLGSAHEPILEHNARQRNPSLRTLRLLLKHGADVHAQGGCLKIAIREGNLAFVKELYRARWKGSFTLNQGMGTGMQNIALTPLAHAVQSCQVEVIAYLLALGADVNAADRSGRTPLHFACQHAETKRRTALVREKGREIETVEVMCDSGAEISRMAKNGETPVNVAARFGALSALEVLFERGARSDLNEADVGYLKGFLDEDAYGEDFRARARGIIERWIPEEMKDIS